MRRSLRVLLLIVLLAAFPAWAQRVSGLVRLPSGTAAPQGTLVTLESKAFSVAAQTNTDSSGRFVCPGGVKGVYVVRAHLEGYEDATEEIDTRTASTAYVVLTLKGLPGNRAAATPDPASVSVPEEARKEFDRGNALLMEKKDPKGSIPYFQKAIKAYPSYAEAYVLMGTAYLDQQKWKEAQEALQKALSINDKIPGAYLGVGSSLAAQQKFAEAEKPLLQGLQLDDKSAQGHYELGRVYWALNRFADALPPARKAVELDPKFAPAHVLLGNVLLRNRDALGALREFQDYLRLEPKGPLAPGTAEMVKKIESALAGKK